VPLNICREKEKIFMAKSLVDLAFEYVCSKGEACDFETIWNVVCETKGVETTNMAKKSQFYSTLFIDGRLYINENGKWDLATYQNIEKKKEHYGADDSSDEVVGEDGETETYLDETEDDDEPRKESSDEYTEEELN
jgi:DNA-directed RNA polymerase delta subunit